MPVVSVIMAAYNAAAYIDEALASASAQTLRDLEIIVVDDASTDATIDCVEVAMRSDPRIQLLRQAANAGPSAARNRAIDAARGEWIALLDADDSFVADRLERLVALAGRHGAELCSDNLLLVPEASPETAHAMIPEAVLAGDRELGLHEFIARNVADKRWPRLNLGFLKPIIARRFLLNHRIRYDESVRFAEDFALYVDCLQAGATWWMTSYSGYRYRLRAGSLTHIQTVDDLAALRRKQAALLHAVRADPKLCDLVARHARSVDRSYFYRAFTDAVKDARYAAAQQVFFSSSSSGVLISKEAAVQLPVILQKMIKGGYLGGKKKG